MHCYSSNRAKVHTTDADASSHQISSLEPGGVYLFRVAAINANGTGDFCSWVEARTYSQDLDGNPLTGSGSPYF